MGTVYAGLAEDVHVVEIKRQVGMDSPGGKGLNVGMGVFNMISWRGSVDGCWEWHTRGGLNGRLSGWGAEDGWLKVLE